jgi:hypothetical protein
VERLRVSVLVSFALALSFATGRAAAAAPSWLTAALVSLQTAANELERVPDDSGGHRDRALGRVRQAMDEVRSTIDYVRRF